MLAFDSRSMQALLADKFSKYFTVTYPIFYQNKHNKGTYEKPKFFYRNAIDIALMANQSKAVQKIIDYIIKYQNNYISFFLFRANFPILLKKGITVGPLLKSKVFYFSFEMMEWPSIHTNRNTVIRNYEYSVFAIRQHYLTTFPEDSYARIPEDVKMDTSELHKIEYSVNLLPYVAHHMESAIGDKYSKFLDSIEKIDVDLMYLIS